MLYPHPIIPPDLREKPYSTVNSNVGHRKARTMTLDPQTIETLKWFGLGIGWLITTYVTYRIGRRAKYDDIQIGRRHNFAEQLSALLQKDFHNRKLLAEQYHSNFDHISNISEAIHYFNKHETLYQGMRDAMSELPAGVDKLQEINRSAAIYLVESTTCAIEEYIENTRFSFKSDGIGLMNNYAECFFTNLLDETRSSKLAEGYKNAMRGLRKAVH